MAKLSICISAYNSEDKIENTLKSVAWADEIIVVNGPSADSTEKICRQYTENVYKFPYETNLSVKKNFSFSKAKGEWIMYIDSDEVVTDELREEVLTVINNKAPYDGFYVPRKNHFLGRWIKHCGWYPDHTLRLFRNGHAAFPCEHVHETVKLNGICGYLKNHVHHYPHVSLSEYISKMNFFTTFEAEYTAKLHEGKYKGGISDFISDPRMRKPILRAVWNKSVPSKPLIRFFIMYFLRRGFLDGWHGFLVCVMSAFYDFVQDAKVKEILSNGKIGR